MKQKQNQKQQMRQQRQQQVTKVSQVRKDSSTKYLCLFIVVVAFSLAFALLINKQQNDAYMNDLAGNNIGVTPEVGRVIVARDLNAIYPKYYVAYTEDDEYSIYVYNYYETSSQYELEYNRLMDEIVDYNVKDKMIRYLYDRGYGTYNEVLNNLQIIVNSDNLRIY